MPFPAPGAETLSIFPSSPSSTGLSGETDTIDELAFLLLAHSFPFIFVRKNAIHTAKVAPVYRTQLDISNRKPQHLNLDLIGNNLGFGMPKQALRTALLNSLSVYVDVTETGLGKKYQRSALVRLLVPYSSCGIMCLHKNGRECVEVQERDVMVVYAYCVILAIQQALGLVINDGWHSQMFEATLMN